MKIDIGDATYPAKYEVCPTCKGQGTSSAYLGAFTSDDMYELGPEFQQDYMEGLYDKECPECNGRTTVLVVDENRLTEQERDEVDRFYREMNNLKAMEAAERRMGC